MWWQQILTDIVNGKTTFADFMGLELLPSELGGKGER